MPRKQWSKVRVIVWEMDRFSGRKELDRHEFDTPEQAQEFVTEYNSHNNEEKVPDWYSYAEIVG